MGAQQQAMLMIGGTTFNPANLRGRGSTATLSNGNLTLQGGTGVGGSGMTTSLYATGKVYIEFKLDVVDNVNSISIGVSNTDSIGSMPPDQWGEGIDSWGYYAMRGFKLHNGVTTTGYTVCVVNDVVGVAIDVTGGNIWWSVNNTWLEGNPSAGTGASYTGLAGRIFAGAACHNFVTVDPKVTMRALASSQTYSPPTGFTAWG